VTHSETALSSWIIIRGEINTRTPPTIVSSIVVNKAKEPMKNARIAPGIPGPAPVNWMFPILPAEASANPRRNTCRTGRKAYLMIFLRYFRPVPLVNSKK